MDRKKDLCSIRLLFAISLALLLPSLALAQLVHLHDSESEHLAREALSTLNKLETPASGMFQGMLRNLDAAHQRALSVLWERGQANLASRVDKMVEWNWRTFSKEVESSQNQFVEAYKRAVVLRQESSDCVDNLGPKLEAAEGHLKAAKEELGRHDAGEREFSRAIEHYESAVGEMQKITADPSLARHLKRLELGKRQGYLKKLQNMVKAADTKAGLRPLYLDLGLALAMLEMGELKAEFEYHKWAVAVAGERLGRLEKILGSAPGDPGPTTNHFPGGDGNSSPGAFAIMLQDSRAGADLDGKNAFGGEPDELIVITLKRLARNAHEEGNLSADAAGIGEFSKRFPANVALRELLNLLASYASIEGYQKFLLEADANEDGFQSRRESIILAQIEDRKLDMLIAHALQGALAYQGGGLRPMEILNMAGGLRP